MKVHLLDLKNRTIKVNLFNKYGYDYVHSPTKCRNKIDHPRLAKSLDLVTCIRCIEKAKKEVPCAT